MILNERRQHKKIGDAYAASPIFFNGAEGGI